MPLYFLMCHDEKKRHGKGGQEGKESNSNQRSIWSREGTIRFAGDKGLLQPSCVGDAFALPILHPPPFAAKEQDMVIFLSF